MMISCKLFYFHFKVMHFVFFLLILFQFIFLIKEKFSIFHLWNVQFLNCKQYVGARIITLMSISDGLGPCLSCRKTEKACPMREDMDRKVVYFPPE